jgi:DNA-binding XRE family transcriptional regulator
MPKQSKPNIASVLKSEIARVARKEIRQEVEALKNADRQRRSQVAELNKLVKELQRALKQVQRMAPPPPQTPPNQGPGNLRFSPARLKAQRQKLGLSAEAFGKLVGVTGLSVYNWERAKTRPSADKLAAIASLRRVGKRAIEARIAEVK